MSDPRYGIADLLPRRTEEEWHRFFDEAERSRARMYRGLWAVMLALVAVVVWLPVVRYVLTLR